MGNSHLKLLISSGYEWIILDTEPSTWHNVFYIHQETLVYIAASS